MLQIIFTSFTAVLDQQTY